MRREIQVGGCTVSFEETEELKEKVYRTILGYYLDQEAFSGEAIMQCDEPIIEAPNLLSKIADDVFKFKVTEID
jgi:hypothetical protein